MESELTNIEMKEMIGLLRATYYERLITFDLLASTDYE